MALTAKFTKKFVAELFQGVHNVEATDALYIILMDTAFTFDWETDDTYADVKTNEIATAGGYTKINKTLANVTVVEGGAGVHPVVNCDNASWTATDGTFEATKGACVVAGTADADTVVGYIDFGGNWSTPDGTTLEIDFQSGLMDPSVLNV